MGREVKQVSKDFDWPLNKTWWGFLLDEVIVRCGSCEYLEEQEKPLSDKCPQCYGERYVSTSNEVLPDWGMWYQMWETTSEGSPISPPFETHEELAHWLADNNASSFGSRGATYEQWLGMIAGSGHAMSMMFSQRTGLISGVEAMSSD